MGEARAARTLMADGRARCWGCEDKSSPGAGHIGPRAMIASRPVVDREFQWLQRTMRSLRVLPAVQQRTIMVGFRRPGEPAVLPPQRRRITPIQPILAWQWEIELGQRGHASVYDRRPSAIASTAAAPPIDPLPFIPLAECLDRLEGCDWAAGARMACTAGQCHDGPE